jgi:hypothetical protein
MDDTEPSAPPPPAPPPPEPDPLAEFRRWLADYAEVGDPVTALIHFRHLKALKADLDQALSVLGGEIIDEWGRGVHQVDGAGAFDLKRGAASYDYPEDPHEADRLFRDVLASVPEGEDPMPVIRQVWNMHPRYARWTPVSALGLSPSDYRTAKGYKTNIILL